MLHEYHIGVTAFVKLCIMTSPVFTGMFEIGLGVNQGGIPSSAVKSTKSKCCAHPNNEYCQRSAETVVENVHYSEGVSLRES